MTIPYETPSERLERLVLLLESQGVLLIVPGEPNLYDPGRAPVGENTYIVQTTEHGFVHTLTEFDDGAAGFGIAMTIEKYNNSDGALVSTHVAKTTLGLVNEDNEPVMVSQINGPELNSFITETYPFEYIDIVFDTPPGDFDIPIDCLEWATPDMCDRMSTAIDHADDGNGGLPGWDEEFN